MSRKKKKSRFTKTDVNTICEMQRKIDAYESYIIGLAGYSSLLNKQRNYVVIQMGTDMDKWVEMAWKNIETMKSICERHHAEEIAKMTKIKEKSNENTKED